MDIFLDLDGPLLDVEEKYYRVYADLVGEFGGRPLPKAEYWEGKRRRVPEKELLKRSGVEGRFEDYRRERVGRIETRPYLELDRVWPGAAEALSFLREKGPLSLVTLRGSAEALRWELEHLGLGPYFERVLSAPASGSERGRTKAELVRRGAPPSKAGGWFVGDTETDVEAGRLLGCRTAAVTYGIREKDLLEAAGADVFLETPSAFASWAREGAR